MGANHYCFGGIMQFPQGPPGLKFKTWDPRDQQQ